MKVRNKLRIANIKRSDIRLKTSCSLWFTFVFFFFVGTSLFAQDPNDIRKENLLEQNIENVVENSSEQDVDYTLIFDNLIYFTENPINLNKATFEELQQLSILSDFQISNLLKHIEDNGKLMGIEELQAIDGFDLLAINKIQPYVKISSDFTSPYISLKEIIQNGQNQVFIKEQLILQDQIGYSPIDSALLSEKPDSRYLGSNSRIYTRYRFNYGTKVSLGFTAEKDPGEQLLKGYEKQGFDYFSGHLFLKGFGKIKALAIGDFQAQFGQGLTFYSGLAYGKSSYVMNVKRTAAGLRPYTAVDENRFMRGAAGTFGFKNFEFTSFFSHKNIDANIQTEADTSDILSGSETSYISSFQESGLHRTFTENSRRKTVGETIYGGNVAYKKRNLSVGVTAANIIYGTSLNRNLSYYNQFEFTGSQAFNAGLDYNYIIRNFNFFGEISRSGNGGIAFINGALITLDPKLSFVILHRNYKRDYQGLKAAALGENTKNANENGLYTGVMAGPFRKITISAYYDRFKFPWMQSQVSAPSNGVDYLVQANYTPSKTIDIYGRIRKRNKLKNTSEDIDDIDFLVSNNQTNYRINASYSVSPSVKLRNRIEMIEYKLGDNPTEKGYMVYQDIVYKSLKSPVSFSFRYALFDTDTYNARIYAYENDVLYSFSIPAYYYRGSRAYLTLRYSYKKSLDVWVRYAQTVYSNQTSIGSGLDEIQGNTKSELKVQVRFKF